MSYKSQAKDADPVEPYDESICSPTDERYTICRARVSLRCCSLRDRWNCLTTDPCHFAIYASPFSFNPYL
jgi:hypothetical protein